jgi:Domain of unknown function (DUF4386)
MAMTPGSLVEPGARTLLRVGGFSAIALGSSYLVITALYVLAGAVPSGGKGWLEYLGAHTAIWWAILGLSVLTDFLFLPVAWSLYLALKSANSNATLAGAGLLVLFAVLDLAVTWPNYASLISLSGEYDAATTDAQRAASVAATSYPLAVLTSGLFAVYAILVPSLGILVLSLVMLRGVFGKSIAYLGVLTGVLGIVSVVGPFFLPALDASVIVTSVLTTLWVLFIGFRMLRFGRQ